jgi:hypothetical protein
MLTKAPEERVPQRVRPSRRRHDRDLERSNKVVLHEELRYFPRNREHRLKNRLRATNERRPDTDDILILDSGASVPIVSEQTWEILIDHRVKLPISGIVEGQSQKFKAVSTRTTVLSDSSCYLVLLKSTPRTEPA